ncbi:MAG: uroporphyrinogen III methyltransferase [Alphaproteobacteria bacterium]|nr:MAG: uroporphyrinogen III methyltransferase [Alphaproteobacteria bacterium]
MVRVLVTRAAGPAARTARRLRRAGHEPVRLALVACRDTGAAVPGGNHDGIVFTSAAGVEGLAQRLAGAPPGDLRALPAFCVGPATARAARAAGFARVLVAAGDAKALAAAVRYHFGDGTKAARLLYPAAADRAFDLTGALATHGIAVQTVALYAAELVDPGAGRLAAALDACAGGAALLYSARTAAHLFVLAARHRLGEQMAGLTFLAISENVAAAVPQGLRVAVAARPDEDALLELLGRQGEAGAFPGKEDDKGQ